jgi:LPXTG-motif cell wall-anchored protein
MNDYKYDAEGALAFRVACGVAFVAIVVGIVLWVALGEEWIFYASTAVGLVILVGLGLWLQVRRRRSL